MKRLLTIAFICCYCSVFGALAIRWQANTNVVLNKTLAATYQYYSNIPPTYLQYTNNYMVETNVIYTNTAVKTQTTSFLPMVTTTPDVPINTNYQVFSIYQSKPIGFEITQRTNTSIPLTNWNVSVSSNVFVVTRFYSGTNYFAVRAIHTNLTDKLVLYSPVSAFIYYPTPPDELILTLISNNPPKISIGFTPKIKTNFYTLQTTSDLKAWTNKFPMEKLTNANPFYYKELPATNPYEFFRVFNSKTNTP